MISLPLQASLKEGFHLNGFLSVASAWSDVDYLPSGVEPIYNSYITKSPTFNEDTNVGIQITKVIHDNVSITTQLLARAEKDFDVEATWAFLKYEPNNHWQWRVGRVHTNPYMLSEYIDVAYAYPWVRLPQEVYSQIPADYSRPVGVDLQSQFVLWKRDVTVSAFAGALSSKLNFTAGPNTALRDTLYLNLTHLYAFNLKYGTETFSVRAGYQVTRATLNPNSGTFMEGLNTFLNTLVQNGLIGTDYINYFSAYHAKTSFLGTGYQFNWNNIVSMGELVKRHAATPIIADAIGWYLMGGYRIKKILPHVTYARERLLNNATRRFNSVINGAAMQTFGVPLDVIAQSLVNTSPSYDGGAGAQTSVTVGLRWDVIDNVALKVEYQHVHPDVGGPGLFNVNPQRSANIYSVALNAVM